MSLLTHQIVVPREIARDFGHERVLTDDVLYHGFIWHLCPLALADQQYWVLVSGAVGLIQPLAGDLRATVVEDAVVDAVLMSEPDTDAGAASVSLKHRHMTWRVSDKAPAHVGIQLKRLKEALRSCRDLCDCSGHKFSHPAK